MAKTFRVKEEFTVGSNIFVIIMEIVGVPIVLLLLFWRFQDVYSDTPSPVQDNLMSYWWRDVMGDFLWLYIIVAALLVMWMVAKALRVWERHKKEEWLAMTLSLIAKRLNISDSDIDAEFRERELNLKLKKLKPLPRQNEIRKKSSKKQRKARRNNEH